MRVGELPEPRRADQADDPIFLDRLPRIAAQGGQKVHGSHAHGRGAIGRRGHAKPRAAVHHGTTWPASPAEGAGIVRCSAAIEDCIRTRVTPMAISSSILWKCPAG